MMMIQMMMFLSFLSLFYVLFGCSPNYKISASKLLPSAAAAKLAPPNVPNAKQLLYDDDDDD